MMMMTMTISRQSQEWGVCANNSTLYSRIGMASTTNDDVDVNRVVIPRELDSDFGDLPHWSNGTIATNIEFYMLNVIAMYSNMDGLCSTPYYGFSRGMTELKQEGYDATVSKLSDNLIGMNAVNILDKK